MQKSELIQLVQDIMTVNGTEQEVDQWLDTFVAGVPHPQAADLIFYPERELTAEEIVEMALAYQPLVGGSS